jgi:hypothetical protein
LFVCFKLNEGKIFPKKIFTGQLKVALAEYSKEITQHREKYDAGQRSVSSPHGLDSSILRHQPAKKLKELWEDITLRASLFEEDLPEIARALKTSLKAMSGWEMAEKLEEKNKVRVHQLNLLRDRYKTLQEALRDAVQAKVRFTTNPFLSFFSLLLMTNFFLSPVFRVEFKASFNASSRKLHTTQRLCGTFPIG